MTGEDTWCWRSLDHRTTPDLHYLRRCDLSMTFPEPTAESPGHAQARSNLSHECAVCLESSPVVALTPCGHLVCTCCEQKLPQRKCPVCSAVVSGHQNLFGA
mmetsp:Transcript_47577/g.137447  ORF Transcript_47577/g.137447 Transcript_47577/m.137447 type:complete len:102 (+) Transcript_47577:1-306(+)